MIFETHNGKKFVVHRSVLLDGTRENPNDLVPRGDGFIVILQQVSYYMEEEIQKSDRISCDRPFWVLYK